MGHKIDFRILLVMLVLILAVIAGWFLLASSVKKDSNLTVVRYAQIKIYDPVYIADAKGFFADEGIKIEWTGEMYGGPQAITAVATGSADAGVAAITALANARTAGLKVKAVADIQSSFKDAPIHLWYALADSNINSPKDFIGKRIGVNTLGASFHYTTLLYLKQNGVPSDSVTFVVIPHPNMEQALRGKQIDIAGMVDPYTAHIEAVGGVKKLFTTIDVLGETQVVTIFFSDKFLNDHPETVRSFIKAYNRAIDFIQSNPDEANQILSKALGVETKYIVPHKFQPNARINFADVNKWIEMLVERGDLKEGQVKPEDIATNQFNPFE